MYTKNLTVTELYASFAQAATIAEFFEQGIRLENDRLSVSALEELIRRGELDLIIDELDWAFDRANMANQPGAVSLIASTLRDSCRELDPLLCHYGKELFAGQYIGPTQWLKENSDDLSISLRRKPKAWAKPYLEPEFVSPFDTERLTDQLARNTAAKVRCDQLAKDSFCSWATESTIGQALPGNDR